MKTKPYICLSLGLSKAMGQYHEVMIFRASTTLVMLNTAYLVPGSYATGIIYKWNLTTRYPFGPVLHRPIQKMRTMLQQNWVDLENRSLPNSRVLGRYGIQFGF